MVNSYNFIFCYLRPMEIFINVIKVLNLINNNFKYKCSIKYEYCITYQVISNLITLKLVYTRRI